MALKRINGSKYSRSLSDVRCALRSALGGVFVLAVAACSTPAPSPEQDVARIEHMCSSCHGINGISEFSNFPRLAGQQKTYIVNQLRTFQDRSRADPRAHVYMWGMAANLRDPMIDKIAADYAAMAPAPGMPGDPADTDAGRATDMNGIVDHGVPACIRCHGSQARGADAYPRLAGQHRDYLERQLTYFASNARNNKTMHQNATNLNEDQILRACDISRCPVGSDRVLCPKRQTSRQRNRQVSGECSIEGSREMRYPFPNLRSGHRSVAQHQCAAALNERRCGTRIPTRTLFARWGVDTHPV